MAMEVLTVPQWLVWAVSAIVSVAAVFCVALLGYLLKFYLQDRQQTEDAHRAIGTRIDSARDEVKAEVEEVKGAVSGLSAKMDSFTAVAHEISGYLRGFKDGKASKDSGGQRE